jgi:hypothetical protein
MTWKYRITFPCLCISRLKIIYEDSYEKWAAAG